MSGSCEVKTCWTDLDNKKLLNGESYILWQQLSISEVSNLLIIPTPVCEHFNSEFEMFWQLDWNMFNISKKTLAQIDMLVGSYIADRLSIIP